MDIQTARKKLMENAEFREAYIKQDLALEVANMIIEARIARNMTQEQLANRMGTRQPAIARLENGVNLPSLPMLQKIAIALDTELLAPKFEFMAYEPQKVEVKTNKSMIGKVIEHVFPSDNSHNFGISEISLAIRG